ncbi:hypothetical protein LR48_Vigan05g011800 [Vigna angularis]|uniref:Uncharacterized protein n=1 Tax=Phaseolus angularis TaxID=3914 RepID=A0A0L9UIY8_PHAAN|nr:hypothetical protein LR48_Vigan05g011700 [Vigna angularis]KOM42514.1 hypothetical protein LR48_Vigan05g011800 [Vigna angularis]
MSIVLLSLFEESRGRGDWGYANDESASSILSVGSSILGSTVREVDFGDAAAGVDINNAPTSVNTGEVVAIKVDVTGEWDGSCMLVLLVPGYGWAPHEFGEYVSSFIMGYSLEEFVDRVAMTKVVKDNEHFKHALCKKNERVFHEKEDVEHDFFYTYSTLFKLILINLNYYLKMTVRSMLFNRLIFG